MRWKQIIMKPQLPPGQLTDILLSEAMQQEKQLFHHGAITCYDHSVAVAWMSLQIARLLQLEVNIDSLLRGALLHDYYLYDWHDRSSHDGLHGFRHAQKALQNAEQDFELDDIQRDIIAKHMFPMNPALPKYKETVIVSVADKLCTIWEVTGLALLGLLGTYRDD